MNSAQIISPADRVLVTGSNGFIGAKVVELLFEHGFTNVRCFVRPSSKLDRLKSVLAAQPAGGGRGNCYRRSPGARRLSPRR